MFDIGITELIVVASMALVILGPEKLPLFFRTIGSLIGRAQSYVSDVKDDIKKQIELEDLSKTTKTISDFSSSVSDEISNFNRELSDLKGVEQKNIQTEKKSGFFIGSPTLSWPEENSYVKLRDRLRERNRQRLLKNRKKY